MNAMKTATSASFNYLIIGSGRVARHLLHYFDLLQLPHSNWDRSQDPHALQPKLATATHVLLAISDQALPGFYRQHVAGHDAIAVHFSGALHLEGLFSAHPLMTFGPQLYDFEFYKKIHFVISGNASSKTPHLQDVLPGLENPFSLLEPEKKALYHASCVIGGNFVSLLAAHMLSEFEKLQIPPSAAKLYLERVIANTLDNPAQAATGPLVRKDENTVRANLLAIEGTAYHDIYKSFLKAYWPDYPRK